MAELRTDCVICGKPAVELLEMGHVRVTAEGRKIEQPRIYEPRCADHDLEKQMLKLFRASCHG